jgi:vacuolar-type H+-ATPase subunit I/STV1
MGFTYDILKDGKTIALYPFRQIDPMIYSDEKSSYIVDPRKMLEKCNQAIRERQEEIEKIKLHQDTLFPKVKEYFLVKIEESSSLQQLYNVVEKFHAKSNLYTTYRYDEIWFLEDSIEKLIAFQKFLLEYQSQEFTGEFSY